MLTAPRRTLSLLTVALCVAGFVQIDQAVAGRATPAVPARAAAPVLAAPTVARPAASRPVARSVARTVAPKAVVCSATVALHTTSACAFPDGGGTAQYGFTTAGADTIRYHAGVVGAAISLTATVIGTDGKQLCSTTVGNTTFDCQVPSAGSYRVDVTTAQTATVYTSIDGVLGDSCAAAPDLGIGSPGVDVDLTDPGASYCAELPVDAPARLDLVLDSQGDAGLVVTIYDPAGNALCVLGQVTPFARSECALTNTNSFRLFATVLDDSAQDTTLFVTRLSNPSGCATGRLDAFGQNPSRRGTLAPHQAMCFQFRGTAGQRIGVHLLGNGGTISTLRWTLRDADGTARCTGAQGIAAISPCALPAAGQYTVIVSTLSRQDAKYVLSLTDLAGTAGCQPVASTAWDATTEPGSWAHTAEVDCHSFTVGAAAHPGVRAALYAGTTLPAQSLVVAADGSTLCSFIARSDCALPGAGTYRLIVSTSDLGAVPYRIQVTELASSAGCTATTPDAMNSGPTRTVTLSENLLQACWTFTGPAAAAYFVNSTGLDDSSFDTRTEVRSLDGTRVCADTYGPCTLPSAGTYLFVLRFGPDLTLPAHDEPSMAGIWRLDRPTSCPTTGTAFTAPAVHGNIATPLELDCNQFSGAPGDRVQIRTAPFDYTVTQRIFAADGTLVCVGANSACTLAGPAPYRIVTYAVAAQTRPYRFRVASLTRGAGCASLAVLPFGRAPGRGFEVSDAADLLCYRINRTAAAAGALKIRLVGLAGTQDSPRIDVYAAASGANVCTEFGAIGTCFVPAGAADYLLVLSSFDAGTTGTLGVFDATTSAGCRAGPDLSFGVAATVGRIAGRGALDCLQLPAAGKDYLRVAFGPVPSGLRISTALVDQRGAALCTFDSGSGSGDCHLAANALGPLRLISFAYENGPVYAGSYRIHAWRLNNPSGCTAIGSLRDGFGPLVGTLADPHDEACYLGDTRPGTLSITTSNDDVPADLPSVQFVRASGRAVDCGITGSGTCQLFTGGVKTIVVRNFGSEFSGHYRIEGECTSAHCGP